MQETYIRKFTNITAPLLIRGETGTGKSFLAREIFNNSRIHKEKFLTVHLASLKEELIESELFGFKRGSFTGALESSSGYLRDVAAGTLFLDEIGELSLNAQKKLLYLLEERKFTPIGSTLCHDFKGRIIMATNKPLEKMVAEGSFREDLYYRITVFQLELSSLRMNPKLFDEAIEKIWKDLKEKYQKPVILSAEVKEHLKSREWRGNFRELKNSLEYALVMGSGSQIKLSDFPGSSNVSGNKDKTHDEGHFLSAFSEDFSESVEQFERMYLLEQFKKNAGRVNDTARKLGISKTTLIQKARKYQINTLKIRAEAIEAYSLLSA